MFASVVAIGACVEKVLAQIDLTFLWVLPELPGFTFRFLFEHFVGILVTVFKHRLVFCVIKFGNLF